MRRRVDAGADRDLERRVRGSRAEPVRGGDRRRLRAAERRAAGSARATSARRSPPPAARPGASPGPCAGRRELVAVLVAGRSGAARRPRGRARGCAGPPCRPQHHGALFSASGTGSRSTASSTEPPSPVSSNVAVLRRGRVGVGVRGEDERAVLDLDVGDPDVLRLLDDLRAHEVDAGDRQRRASASAGSSARRASTEACRTSHRHRRRGRRAQGRARRRSRARAPRGPGQSTGALSAGT